MKYKDFVKDKMLETINEAQAIAVMAPQDLKKYLIENHENFEPKEFDELNNPYVFKCGILAGKILILKSCIEDLEG